MLKCSGRGIYSSYKDKNFIRTQKVWQKVKEEKDLNICKYIKANSVLNLVHNKGWSYARASMQQKEVWAPVQPQLGHLADAPLAPCRMENKLDWWSARLKGRCYTKHPVLDRRQLRTPCLNWLYVCYQCSLNQRMSGVPTCPKGI